MMQERSGYMARYENQKGRTISCHNGGSKQANRYHNIRHPAAVKHMTHIDSSLTPLNEYWVDIPPREAYQQAFGQALDDYNSRQKRDDRKIKDYYTHVSKDAKKHTVYEIIYQIGDHDDTGTNDANAESCLQEMIEGWERRNPSLFLIGAYLHRDEDSGTSHVHANYIPVATGYKKGMSVQNSLTKALQQQGFVTKGSKLTAQMQWEESERKCLEQICIKHGIEVYHPKQDAQHLDTAEYKKARERENKAKRDAEEQEKKLEEIKGEILSTEQVAEIKVKKNLLNKDVVFMGVEDAKNLRTTAARAEFLQKVNNELMSAVERRTEVLEQREEHLQQIENLFRLEMKQRSEELYGQEEKLSYREEQIGKRENEQSERLEETWKRSMADIQKMEQEAEQRAQIIINTAKQKAADAIGKLETERLNLQHENSILQQDNKTLKAQNADLSRYVENAIQEGKRQGFQEGMDLTRTFVDEAKKKASGIIQKAENEADEKIRQTAQAAAAFREQTNWNCNKMIEGAEERAESIVKEAASRAEREVKQIYRKAQAKYEAAEEAEKTAQNMIEEAANKAETMINNAEKEISNFSFIRDFYNKLMKLCDWIPARDREIPEFWASCMEKAFKLRSVEDELTRLKEMITYIPEFIVNRAKSIYEFKKRARSPYEDPVDPTPPAAHNKKKIR